MRKVFMGAVIRRPMHI